MILGIPAAHALVIGTAIASLGMIILLAGLVALVWTKWREPHA